jgi:endogenous inhibitor of DNA gyrase (YacG/DUF329 family)
MAKTTISKLKKKLDKLFSEYVRRKNSDDIGMTNCFTCGTKKHWKEQHAGHFMSRRHHSTRWDEINVQVQCPKCNLFNQGEQYKFGLYLDQRYGEGTAEELNIRSKTIVKINRVDYEEAIQNIKNKLKTLL